jgi:hypothetical protein
MSESGTDGTRSSVKWRLIVVVLVLAALAALVYKQSF